jgi:hypothetical protein
VLFDPSDSSRCEGQTVAWTRAEWIADLPSYVSYTSFEKRTSAPDKRYVEREEGIHTLIIEKSRMQLFNAVQQFLDEAINLAVIIAASQGLRWQTVMMGFRSH